jgi:hypothetical protein
MKGRGLGKDRGRGGGAHPRARIASETGAGSPSSDSHVCTGSSRAACRDSIVDVFAASQAGRPACWLACSWLGMHSHHIGIESANFQS